MDLIAIFRRSQYSEKFVLLKQIFYYHNLQGCAVFWIRSTRTYHHPCHCCGEIVGHLAGRLSHQLLSALRYMWGSKTTLPCAQCVIEKIARMQCFVWRKTHFSDSFKHHDKLSLTHLHWSLDNNRIGRASSLLIHLPGKWLRMTDNLTVSPIASCSYWRDQNSVYCSVYVSSMYCSVWETAAVGRLASRAIFSGAAPYMGGNEGNKWRKSARHSELL